MTDKETKAIKTMIKGLNNEELKIVLRAIPDNALWEELKSRYEQNLDIIKNMRRIAGGNNETA